MEKKNKTRKPRTNKAKVTENKIEIKTEAVTIPVRNFEDDVKKICNEIKPTSTNTILEIINKIEKIYAPGAYDKSLALSIIKGFMKR